ncbi:tubulin-tyrosine ligase family protein, putative [Ichthyophthirius multifiliis]|uniref:Tubulin-tyrosine ligase family protein, putative n=1 Tax=Ichthyophthirius multifiliis TaxID=5932 RepID=G0QT03_ICHMU|nr:tubulin-tyrosine ligase family protein, putative [Ichthyophthirius multifiliis]EGR31656.1 tubulin-tyrosine ligase family protein, putative [Ichthyophthirius multifiliis]|eukprot:XP_004035142.1 tubulin-tyrosine ligase family protein, putative [Ichthyophthirius multifiliis]
MQQIRENQQNDAEYNDLEDENDREQEKQQQANTNNQRKELISPEIIANWKKIRGYPPNQKVYIILGQYQDLRNYLNSEGWIENENQESLIFDLKWVTKMKDVDHVQLLDQQITNHFEKNFNLTSKNGLAKNLRNLIQSENIDFDVFYPRCFDLGDVQEFEDFVEEFKFSHAESVVKQFVQENKNSQTEFNQFQLIQVLVAVYSLIKKTKSILQKINEIVYIYTYIYINIYILYIYIFIYYYFLYYYYIYQQYKLIIFLYQLNQKNNQVPIISAEEWKIINYQCDYVYIRKNQDLCFKIFQKIQEELGITQENILEECHKQLENLKNYDIQTQLNNKNMWIVKPAGLSRGRGIRTFQQLEPLLNYVIGKNVNWVAQKYMENPLTINKKKFDIRQWALVSEWNPLQIFFYDECYIRLCFEDYTADNLENKFVHLANNCISKQAEGFQEKVNETMMCLDDFIEYIKKQENGRDFYNEKIKKQMQNIVINSIKSCKDTMINRKNSFEIYGYDFMVDENYNVWLLEVNSSPSMEHSTRQYKKIQISQIYMK